MAGRDLSSELFGDNTGGGKDLSAELGYTAKNLSTEDKLKALAAARSPELDAKLARESASGKSDTNSILSNVGNMASGLVRGAGSIGSTLVLPADLINDKLAGKELSLDSNRDRRAYIDEFLRGKLGADTSSNNYKLGKATSEIAGTAGMGGAIGNAAKYIAPELAASSPALMNAITSGGFSTGANVAKNAPMLARAADLGTRASISAFTGGASAALLNPEDAKTGMIVGGALPIASSIASKTVGATSGALKSGAKKLMQSAIKPNIADLKSGDASTAINTMLEYGINPTMGGVSKIQGKISGLNDEISSAIENSNATIGRDEVLSYLGDVNKRFTNQVTPKSDLEAIKNVSEDFSNHPYFQSVESKGQELRNLLDRANSEKIKSLQAAGKLKTFAAQQKSLAEGKNISLAPSQAENQLYFNVGNSGGDALSPSAYPVLGYPRFPSRYTNNIDRVIEGEAGAKDAMDLFYAKRLEENNAGKMLADWESSRGNLPVQLAQEIKKGTYSILNKKYGQIGTADTEAQKGLARGLKEEIANAVPGVAGLNAEESKLITTLDVAERRALMELNKNPLGLSTLAHSPAAWAAFMADKSALFKSLSARILNSTSSAMTNSSGILGRDVSNPMIRTGLLNHYSNVAENQK